MFAQGSGLTPSGSVIVETTVEGAGAPEVCTEAELQVGYSCDAGVPGAGKAQFGEFALLPLAVDATGNVWVGDFNRLEEFGREGDFLSELALPGTNEIASLAVDPSGDFYALNPTRDETQRLRAPANGTYTLTFEGETTQPIPFDATEAEVQAALAALPGIGQGNVKVDQRSPGVFSVQFVGALDATNVPQLVPSAGSVTTVRDGVLARLAKLTHSGELLYTLDTSGHPNALGLDPATGNLFVSDQTKPTSHSERSPATLLEYGPTGSQLEAFGSGEVLGGPEGNALAFGDAAQRLYVAGEDEGAAQILTLPQAGPLPEAGSARAEAKKTTATLGARVNPEGASSTYHFQYLTAAKYEAQKKKAEEEGKTPAEVAEAAFAGAFETPESAPIGEDFYFDPASQSVSGLTPATLYRFRLLAHNENGAVAGEAASFATEPPAAVDSTSASAVTGESATLEAEINPLGDATSYRFEYLTEAEYLENGATFSGPNPPTLAPLPDAAIGAGEADVAVFQHLQGLSPHTAYRYRAFAHNHCNSVQPAEDCTVAGPTRAFTTQSTAPSALPDQRAWELVSPPDKHGAGLLPISVGPTQAAASGDAIAYLASAPTEAQPEGNTNKTEVLSTHGPSGWNSLDLAIPHAQATGLSVGDGQEYRFFSSDLSLAILQPFGSFDPSLSPEASEQTAYLHADFPTGDPASPCTEFCYRPIATAKEGFADIPPGTAFGEEGKCPERQLICGPQFLGATPDLAHVILGSKVALTATKLPSNGAGLYEWSADRPPAEALQLLSLLPGEPAKPVVASLGTGGNPSRNAISADGSRVVWITGEHHLYLRDTARGETVQLDAVQGGSGAGQAESVFQLASADGSRVLFTDRQRLTAGSGGGEGKSDLYECRIEEEAGHLRCALSDLTPESTGEAAAVQGLLLGASQDGSSLYFAANGALAHNTVDNGNGPEQAQPANCSNSSGVACNLYLYHAGTTTFIATLAAGSNGAGDSPDWGTQNRNLNELTARVSSDGRFLAFMSQRPLTGYDNRDAVSGRRDEEVFLYDAAANGGQGKLICASCNPTGARPHGVEYARTNADQGGLVGGERVWPNDAWLAANVPAWTPYGPGESLYQSRYLSDAGRLFFNSSDALVPQDTNGSEDVYQYEPAAGAGTPPNDTCTEASPTYGPASKGCVDLISSGTSKEESAFLDASESGNDVFFLTSAQLSHRDSDTALDVYDARVGGSEAEAIKPPACEGDACQSPVSPPSDPTPGSLTFQGPGNLMGEVKPPPPSKKTVKCKKSRKLSHSKCVKPKSRKKTKKARKASNDRRATR
jgi:hypothetical protein